MIINAQHMDREGFTCPLILGGATTSKQHTAVKIAPQYRGPVIHVLDASKTIPVLNALCDPELCPQFLAEMNEDYEQLR